MSNWYSTFVRNRNSFTNWNNVYNSYLRPIGENMFGYTQMKNTQSSNKATIDYEQYIRRGNERALEDWNRNVGSQGRSIRYPEFSYPGAIRRSNTSIAIAGFGYDNAYANYVAGIPGRAYSVYGYGSGLYSVPNRSYSRYM